MSWWCYQDSFYILYKWFLEIAFRNNFRISRHSLPQTLSKFQIIPNLFFFFVFVDVTPKAFEQLKHNQRK